MVDVDLRGVEWGELGGWPAPLRKAKQTQNFKIDCGCYGRIKGKFSVKVPNCNLYFVALLVFLVKQFYIRLQFSNCNILGTCPIDSAT